MSYHVWSVDGYGFDVTKTIDSITAEKWSMLKETIRLFWEEETPYRDEEYPEAKDYLKVPADKNNFRQEIDAAREVFIDYESDNYGECGFDFLVAEVYTWLWSKNRHSEDLVEIVSDDYDDSHVYWLITQVYPWWNGEIFETKDECCNAIVNSLKGFVEADNINYESIEQGG